MGKTSVRELVASSLKRSQTVLPELESKEILRSWGLPVPPCVVAASVAEAVRSAGQVGYPLAMKVLSPAIVHKSDVGGVKLGLTSEREVEQAFREIEASCRKLDPGFKVLVQPMVKGGIEVILGVSHDPQFGPALMFGAGGVFVELFRDVSFRLIPLKRKDAMEMISSIRAYPLLKGFRGKPGADVDCLADMILSLSELVLAHPEIREIDLNPVLALPQGAAVVDARMVLDSKFAPGL
jgi:acetate---CoA ligase (ADP-forming) subunit beta